MDRRRLVLLAWLLWGCATVPAPSVQHAVCPAGSVTGGVALLTDFLSPEDMDAASGFRCATEALCPAGPGATCGGTIQVPKGTFPLLTTVTIDRPIRVVGVGSASQLIWSGPAGAPALRFNGASAQSVEDLLLAAKTRDSCTSGEKAPAGIGILSKGGRGPWLHGLTLCGFETGIEVQRSADGQIDATVLSQNRAHVVVDGAEAWVLQGVRMEGGGTGLTTSHSAGLRWMGGSIVGASTSALQLRGCLGCSISGLRFEANQLDLLAGGEPSDAVRNLALVHLDGAVKAQITNPGPSCPVDRLHLRHYAGKGSVPAELVLDSACPMRVFSEQSEVRLDRRNSLGAGGLPEITTYEANGFAPSEGTVGGHVVAPGVEEVLSDAVPREQRPDRSLRVLSDGRTLIGTEDGASALTIEADSAGEALELANGTAAFRTQDEMPSRATGGSVALRFLDPMRRPVAVVAAENEAALSATALSLQTSEASREPREALRITHAGRVGVGTGTPRAALEVAGPVKVNGTLDSASVTIPLGSEEDPCTTDGELRLIPAAASKGSDQVRVCVGGAWHTLVAGPP